MTIKAIRENLEQARAEGVIYLDGEYAPLMPTPHEAKLYSICEGLIVEIERLQARVAELEAQ